jgi:NitT/TauT family transport system ATP-binding protein
VKPGDDNCILLVEDVIKSYGQKLVLDDVDFSVREGEFCSVVGPSGCGKSTLLRLVLGQEFPSAGRVHIDGKEVGHPNPERGIVYQKYTLFPHLSVLENVMLGMRLTHSLPQWLRKRRELRDEAVSMLERMRLGGDLKKYPHQLSGGMQQRVAIAQAMIMKPRILLMDEPFGALDPGTREDMQVYLLEVWEELKTTIFFVTHDLEEAAFLGTRLLVLSQYYSDERGDGPNVVRGARLVADYQIKTSAGSTVVKGTAEFGELLQQVKQEGFEADYRKHVDEFNLRHPDAWRTLREEETSKKPSK